MNRILLVEDEANLRKLVKLNLEHENFEVIIATNGREALNKFSEAHYDLIILDLMLPLLNGIDVLDAIRVKNSHIPVIITSAKDTSTDRIHGLKKGADDYLVKPFEMEELILRIDKLLTRSSENNTTVKLDEFSFGDNYINFTTYEARHLNNTSTLKQKEVLILKYLITHENEVVSRQDILRNVWGYDVFPSTRTIDNFITSLRKFFEVEPRDPKHIISIRGVGYKFLS